VFAVCVGKQCKSVFMEFRHCDLGRAKSLSTHGSSHIHAQMKYGAIQGALIGANSLELRVESKVYFKGLLWIIFVFFWSNSPQLSGMHMLASTCHWRPSRPIKAAQPQLYAANDNRLMRFTANSQAVAASARPSI